MISTRNHTNRLRAIPLPAVLLAVGAEADPHDKVRWHTAQGAISLTGCKFFNWNRDCGGGGAIDLVMHLHGLDFKAAVAWLSGRFPSYLPACALPDCQRTRSDRPADRPAHPTTFTTAPHLELPTPDADMLSAVKHYLVADRKIIPAVVALLVRSGNLYADRHANAVFLLRGECGAPVGAELRGIGPLPWRGMAPGSRKNLGYFSIRDAVFRGITLCESAIDAVSCFLIHPHHWCISTAGARANPAWMPDIISLGIPVHCGFDADPTGDNMAEAMIQRYPAIKRLRPPQHDWNDSLNTLP